MKYCSDCGSSVVLTLPEGDHRERYVCNRCDLIHYQNPNVVVGTVPIHIGDDGLPRVLLCLRDIEPRHGYWTLPAGFLENNETAAEGALRETVEESCAALEDVELYRLFNVVHTNQIHIFFRANMPLAQYSVTPESSEVQLFLFDDIPWGELAFPTVHKTLVDYITDRTKGEFDVVMMDMDHSYWQHMSSKPK